MGTDPRRMNDEKFTEYIFKNGKVYEPALLSEGSMRGKVGDCFDTCVMIAKRDPRFRYVEGLARDPKDPKRWILHSWITDREGRRAFDPTWRAFVEDLEVPVPSVYIGFEMDLEAVARFMIGTRYHGIFANAWRNPDLARKILRDIPAEKISSQFFIELV